MPRILGLGWFHYRVSLSPFRQQYLRGLIPSLGTIFYPDGRLHDGGLPSPVCIVTTQEKSWTVTTEALWIVTVEFGTCCHLSPDLKGKLCASCKEGSPFV